MTLNKSKTLYLHHACRYEKREKYGFEHTCTVFDVFLVLRYHLATMAQLVEHPSGNQKVPGSNPGQGNEFFIYHAGKIKLLSNPRLTDIYHESLRSWHQLCNMAKIMGKSLVAMIKQIFGSSKQWKRYTLGPRYRYWYASIVRKMYQLSSIDQFWYIFVDILVQLTPI